MPEIARRIVAAGTATVLVLATGSCYANEEVDGVPEQSADSRSQSQAGRSLDLTAGFRPISGPQWELHESIVEDTQLQFSVHYTEMSAEYLSLVFTVSATATSGYTGTLTPGSDSVVVADGVTDTLAVQQHWLHSGGVSAGGMSFGAIDPFASSVALIVYRFQRSDTSEIVGPWELEFLKNPVSSSNYDDGFIMTEQDIHTKVPYFHSTGASSSVRAEFNGYGFNHFPFWDSTPVPTVTVMYVTATPGASPTPQFGAIAQTPEPMATIQWAPNAKVFATLRVSDEDASITSYCDFGLEPSTGTFWNLCSTVSE